MTWPHFVNSVIARFRTTESPIATTVPTEEQRTESLIDEVIGSAALSGADPERLERDRELLRSVIRGDRTAEEAIDILMARLVDEGIIDPNWDKRGNNAVE